MPLQNINRQNISDVVYNQFMDALVSGEWKPGDKIPSENELATTLNVSRISVRGALQKLSGLGLIESRQGEGTFVCEFTGAQYANNLVPIIVLEQSNMHHLLEFRKILDCEIAALAAVRADDEIIRQLRENYAHHIAVSHDLKRSAEYDAEFHFTIARATQNPLIIQIYTVFKQIFQKNMYEIVRIMGTSGAEKYHLEILNAIEGREPDIARERMREHIQDTIENALKSEAQKS